MATDLCAKKTGYMTKVSKHLRKSLSTLGKNQKEPITRELFEEIFPDLGTRGELPALEITYGPVQLRFSTLPSATWLSEFIQKTKA